MDYMDKPYNGPLLEPALDPQGHLTDEGAAAMADGQDGLLTAEARRHAESCPECLGRIGDQALRSMEVGHALDAAGLLPALGTAGASAQAAAAQHPEAPDTLEPARPLPWWALAVALAVAVLGMLPTLLAPGTRETVGTLLRVTPALIRTLAQTLQAPEVAGLLERASWAGALALWMAGIGLGYLATRARRDKQGES